MARLDLIQIRRDTGSSWTATNPVLAAGELGIETDTRKIKIGDGTTAWNDLQYLEAAAIHPDLATHDALGLATQAELDTHAAGPHGGGGETAIVVMPIEGEEGPPGPPIPGAQGAQGPQGDPGDPGSPGADGAAGAPGMPGEPGEDAPVYMIPGRDGAPGANGADGATGPQGPTGIGVPGTDGEDAPIYLIPGPVNTTVASHDLTAEHTESGLTDAQFLRATGATTFAFEAIEFSVGGVILDPTAARFVMVWRAPFPCTVTNVRGHRKGGTGATVNARKNQTSDFLASDLSLSSADSWTDGGSVQNTSIAAGDDIEIELASITGAVTEIAIQVDLTRP